MFSLTSLNSLVFNLTYSQALYFSLDIVEGAYGNKNREGFF